MRAFRGPQRAELLQLLQEPPQPDDLDIAPIPAPFTSQQKRAMQAMRDKIAEIAQHENIPEGLLCSRRHMEALVTDRAWPAAALGRDGAKPLLLDALTSLMMRQRWFCEHAMKQHQKAASAFAPASVGNIGVGFDILGHTIEGPGDRATVRIIEEPAVRISAIRNCRVELPFDATLNTAGAALIAMSEALRLPFGFDIELDKGIAFASGMGGSAASCVAALVAANALLDAPLPREQLYPFALVGEAVASGRLHGDNVGAMLLGGIVLSTADKLARVPAPDAWHCVLVHPNLSLRNSPRARVLQKMRINFVILCRKARTSRWCSAAAAPATQIWSVPVSTMSSSNRGAPLIPGFHRVETSGNRSRRARGWHLRRRTERIRVVRISRRSNQGHRIDARRIRRRANRQRTFISPVSRSAASLLP